MNARGVVFVHSSPTAVCPHVEWAISGVLGTKVSLQWAPQGVVPGQMRAECTWTGPVGSGGALAGALRAWPMLRFEVTEEATPGVDGERLRKTTGVAGARLRAVAPVDGATLRPDSVRFTWHREAGDAAYHLTVSDESGSVQWTVDTSDSTIGLPASVHLKAGRSYYWYVDAIGGDGKTRATGLSQFRVAP